MGDDGPSGSYRFPTVVHRLDLGPTTIDLLAPADPDALLDDPITHERYKADNYLPYWPIIWPSGLMLAKKILEEAAVPPAPPPAPAAPRDAIELGCGLGLAGIAAALRGWRVACTDYDPEAAVFAAANARRNGVPMERFRAFQMDWRQPVAERFQWVIASDVLYERRLHPLLLGAVDALLAPGGVAWVSDPNRTSAEDFPMVAAERGYRVSTMVLAGGSFQQPATAATLYVLTRVSPKG